MYLGSLDGKDSESHGKAPESVPADGYHLPSEEGSEVSVIRVPVPPASPPSAANVAEWPALRIRHECRRGGAECQQLSRHPPRIRCLPQSHGRIAGSIDGHAPDRDDATVRLEVLLLECK